MINLIPTKSYKWHSAMVIPTIAFMLCIFSFYASASNLHKTDTTSTLVYDYDKVDVKPKFPEGDDEILSFVGKNFNYPAEAKTEDIEGMVFVKFTVSESGKIADVKAIRGQDLGGGLAEEAERVVREMPLWSPGMEDGKAVKVKCAIRVLCRVNSDKKPTQTRVITIFP